MDDSLDERIAWWRRGLRAALDLLKETGITWWRDRALRLAAALAYYAIFSIAPLLVIIIAITGLVFGERAARAEIANQLEDLVGSQAAVMIETMLTNFGNPASGILTSLIGLGTMLYGATGLFNHVQGALNTIWHAPPKSGNGLVHFFKRRFLHLAMVFSVGAVLLLSLFAEILVTAITEYLNLESLPQTRNFLISLATLTVLFAVIYKILPQVKIAWRDVLVGAAVTSLLFSVGRLLIGAYMGWSHIGSAFGAAGSLVVLLVWVYYSAEIFLLGAEFTHVYARKFGSLAKSTVDAEGGGALLVVPPVVELGTLPDVVAPTPSVAAPKSRDWTKKAIAITTVAGTIAASILGANWLHQKRKNR
jgi:membrane protein